MLLLSGVSLVIVPLSPLVVVTVEDTLDEATQTDPPIDTGVCVHAKSY